MKFAFGLIGLVVVVTLLSGCTGSAAKDCGEDIQCFAEAAETCTPAKVTVSGSGMSMYSEIKGGTIEACTVYYEYDLGALGKVDMTCTAPTTTQIDTSDPQALCDICTGSMLQGVC